MKPVYANFFGVHKTQNADGNLAKDDTKMTVNDQKIYLNDATKYVKVEDDAKDIDVTTAVGGTSAKKDNGPENTTTAIAIQR